MIGDVTVIDLSDASTPTARQTVGKQLVRSIEQIGFFYVVGHGIEPRLATNAFDIAREFFSLNEAQKQKIAVNHFQRGWMRKGLTRLEGSVSADVKEVFFWGREVASNDPDVIGKLPLVAPTNGRINTASFCNISRIIMRSCHSAYDYLNALHLGSIRIPINFIRNTASY